MPIIQALPHHHAIAMEIIQACVADMRLRNIFQWDEVYPNPEIIRDDIARHHLFLWQGEDRFTGTVCLNAEQEDAYQSVDWHTSEPAMIIHRLCVLPTHQGHGIAAKLMDFAEQLAQQRDYASIRLDAYSGNPQALRLYRKLDYQQVGELFFPRRELPFYAFEKTISPSP